MQQQAKRINSTKNQMSIGTDFHVVTESKLETVNQNNMENVVKNGLHLQSKQANEIIKQYQKKISIMSQTISKLTKKNEQQREQFRLLNQKLNKAFSKLTPNKLKSQNEDSPQNQQLERVKKQLEIQMKKNKILKKQNQVLKQTQNLLNNQEKFVELKNDLVDKQREIKELKDKVKAYQRAEESEKKMTHYRKEEEMSKKLHQLNEQNIFMKKKILQLKTKLQDIEKQKLIEKAEQAVQKNLGKQVQQKKPTEQQFIRKQLHEQQVKKLEEQIKVYENLKTSLQKTHKQEVQTLKKQNQILNEQINELKHQIKKKNKEKFMLEHRSQLLSQLKARSRLDNSRNSVTIDLDFSDDKNSRSRSIMIKGDGESSSSMRKQFLGLNYGNFGNEYRKNDDSLKLDDTKGHYVISSIKFKYFEEHILSLSTKYKFSNGQQVEMMSFQVQHSYSNIKTAELVLGQHEYIKEIDIYCGKMVQYIQIRTSRNQQLDVGNDKVQFKSKKYSFDIRSREKPVAFGSVTELKKAGDVRKQCLVVLGLVMRKKDISIAKKRVLLNIKNDPKSKQRENTQSQKQREYTPPIKQIFKNNPKR